MLTNNFLIPWKAKIKSEPSILLGFYTGVRNRAAIPLLLSLAGHEGLKRDLWMPSGQCQPQPHIPTPHDHFWASVLQWSSRRLFQK